MLSIGWTEMMLIAAIALIVVGPKDLPAMLQQVGKFAGQIRRMGNDFKSEINKAVKVDEIADMKKSVTSPLTALKHGIEKDFNSIGTDGKVKPSGALKPADPNAEDVTSEIRKAAGLPTSMEDAGTNAKDAMSEAMRKAQSEATAKVTPDEAAESPKAAAAKKPAAKKPAAKKPSAKTSAAKKPAATKAAAKKPVAAKSTPAKKPAAAKKPVPASKSAAAKPRARRKPATSSADGAST